MKVIAITNQKGGVGKTTSTVNMAASLGVLGFKVLMIDMDPQGNATTGLGISKADLKACIYNVLVDERSIEETVVQTSFENLWVVPATINLSGVDLELASVIGRETRLKQAIEDMQMNFDYVLIDCPPSLGLLTLNALTVSESIIVPIQAEYYALEGLTQLLNTIRLAQRHLNKALVIEGIVLTMVNKTNLSAEVEEEVRNIFDKKVYSTTISRGVRLSEAPSYGQPIYYYDQRSRGAQEYLELAKEVIKNGN
ncbi:MAG: ParA family protein [Culicoidibacterales bacterium]